MMHTVYSRATKSVVTAPRDVRRARRCRAAAYHSSLTLDAAMFQTPRAMTKASTASQSAAAVHIPAILSAAGRTAEQVAVEVEVQLQSCPQALVQGVEPDMYAAMRKLQSGVQYHARAKMLIIKPKQEDQQQPMPKQRRLPGMVCVVSAGPEDQAAADQVKLLAEHLGCFVTAKTNLSIRDLPTLMDQLPALQAADVVIAVAGVDSSLPGAIAGMVDAPVIALPTSHANNDSGLGGLGSLVTAVSSCTLGVSVVGIDQAAAAAMSAARVLRTAAARVEKLMAANNATAAAAAPASVPALMLQEAASANGVSAANNVVPRLDSLSLTPAALPVGAH